MRGANASTVWVFLVERDLAAGGVLALFVDEQAAMAAALRYAQDHWPDPAVSTPAEPADAIAAYNRHQLVDEEVTVAAWPVRRRSVAEEQDPLEGEP